MSSVPVFVGLDYHHHSVQVCVLNEEGRVLLNRSLANDARTIAGAIGRHGRVIRMGIEACCGAANLADELATEHGLPIQLAHPGYVARLKRSPDKHDCGDAQLVADLSRTNYLPVVWLAPETTRQLRRLVRHRAQLVCRRRDVKLRIRGLLRENRIRSDETRAWTKRWLQWLSDEVPLAAGDRYLVNDHLAELRSLTTRIAAIEVEIRRVTADDPVVAQLLTFAGVGFVTAVTLRAEIGRFERFRNGKQLARFCGVTPQNASSGARQADAGLIRAGNPELRMVLIELGHRLCWRMKGRWADLAYRMLKRGKPKNVVVAAVANRWVRRLFHQMRSPMQPAVAADLGSGSTKGAALPSSPSHRPRRGEGRRDGEDGRGSGKV